MKSIKSLDNPNILYKSKAVRGWAVFIVGGDMPSQGDGGRATDTFRPHHAYGQRRNTENRQRLRGLAAASLMPPLRLIAVPPCSFSLLPDKDFFDRPATCRLFQQSTGRDSDNMPSFVVGLSQTRPSETGQFHFTGIDEESGMGDQNRQFHLSILHGILLLCRNSKPRDSVRLHRLLSPLFVSQIQ